jgi:hypothetical protein
MKSSTSSPPRTITVNDFAKIINRPAKHVRKLILAGELPAIHTTVDVNAKRPRYVIPADAIDAWLESRMVNVQAKPKPVRRTKRRPVPQHV